MSQWGGPPGGPNRPRQAPAGPHGVGRYHTPGYSDVSGYGADQHGDTYGDAAGYSDVDYGPDNYGDFNFGAVESGPAGPATGWGGGQQARLDDQEPRHRRAHHLRRDESGSLPGRSFPRWGLPVLLLAGALVAGVGALLLDSHPTAQALDAGSAETPVLSARRAPELLAAPVEAQRLSEQLGPWTAQVPSDSCLVVEGQGQALYTHQGALAVPGASTQKLLTVTAALLSLGPDTRFRTVAAAEAQPDASGVVTGDLYFVGGGDPLLATTSYADSVFRGGDRLNDLGALADQLQAAGVTRIAGDVVGDASRYDEEDYHPTWPERFRGERWLGPVSALNVNDGFASYPDDPYSGGAVLADDPAANAAEVLITLLEERGITVDGVGTSGQAPEGVAELAVLESPPLSEIGAQALMDSDNNTAEMLLKELGLQDSGVGSWEAGTAAVTAALTDAGVDLNGVEVVDGSGLSDQNLLSCQLLVDLLTRPETGPALVAGLSVAGETGTMENWSAGDQGDGQLKGKTGTLNRVSSVAGQATPANGDTLTFAFIATLADPAGVLTYEQTLLREEVGDMLADFDGDVPVEQLLPAGYPADGGAED